MGTEVLRPQDLLVERLRAPPTSFNRRKNFLANGNSTNLDVNRKQHRKPSPKPDKRIFNAAAETKRSSHGGGGVPGPRRKVEVPSGGLVMGEVTLLRRGESLDSITSKITSGNPKDPMIQKSVDDLSFPKQIRVVAAPPTDIYAGSAFSMSPSPRSVPVPSFFNKDNKKDLIDCENKQFYDATRYLRRILRLE
ncbi:hypothetical protein DH2020_019983 [Rehmannia glutinosa]|uniref:Uncharacterized protein n=1 Tax=Rehmannia glutinosa TaxID=99300 RepID=A0ABR0WIF6_REHGL